jgi:hypothetical protein
MMMNREMRKNRIKNQAKSAKWFDPLSEDSIKKHFENCDKTSEARLSKILDPKEAAKIFSKEVAVFAKDYGLETVMATSKNSIPDFDYDVQFQYINAVYDYESRLEDVDNFLAVFIKEEDKVIAFGIAYKEDHETKIEIIEVEINSTRRSGLSKKIKIENLSFEIGVGHIVVLRLLESCQTPMWTDATNEESRYIFKSLGFDHDERSTNPCILRKNE